MIDKIFSIFRKKPEIQVTRINRDSHSISRKQVSPNAIKVLYRLKNSGFDAMLVGGCVRDILLGLHPKDFDVTTNATPEQVKSLFSNSRLIGRRFKLVHVTFGREVIEVATYRAGHEQKESNSSRSNDHGMLVRDNVYGTLDEDARRRDFTVNSLYYDISDFSICAFGQGMKDLQERTIRIIGYAETRYREDPVRMLRAARFAAKLNFDIEQETREPIPDLANLLSNVAPARLFDESLKLLQSGYGYQSFHQLLSLGLLKPLFPGLAPFLHDRSSSDFKLIENALKNTDKRLASGKSVTPAFLFAALLWPEFRHLKQQYLDNGLPEAAAATRSGQEVISRQVRSIAIPKRFSFPVKDIWELQWRLTRTSPKSTQITITHPRFRAGYDFLLLREEAGELEPGLGKWWTEFQESSPEFQKNLIRERARPATKKRRQTRPKTSLAQKPNDS